jgi:hypothetical protein
MTKGRANCIQPRNDREQLIVDEIVDHDLSAEQRTAPRTKRERRLVSETVRDLDDIRAARAQCRDRAIVISPHWPKKERRAALRRLQTGKNQWPITRKEARA